MDWFLFRSLLDLQVLVYLLLHFCGLFHLDLQWQFTSVVDGVLQKIQNHHTGFLYHYLSLPVLRRNISS